MVVNVAMGLVMIITFAVSVPSPYARYPRVLMKSSLRLFPGFVPKVPDALHMYMYIRLFM